MNAVVKGLQQRGLISRPARAESGRRLPTTLTEAGRRAVESGDLAATALERRMTEGLTAADIARLDELLRGCAQRLEGAR